MTIKTPAQTQSLLAVGGHDGEVTIADNSLFSVGSMAILSANGLDARGLKIIGKSGTNQLVLGEVSNGRPPSLTAYTPARKAQISVPAQIISQPASFSKAEPVSTLSLLATDGSSAVTLSNEGGTLALRDRDGNFLGGVGAIGNGGSFIAPGGGGVSRVLANAMTDAHLNVKNYGAIGDGATDDTAAIKLAVVAAQNLHNNTGGGETVQTNPALFFPNGIYLVSDTIVLGGEGYHVIGNGAILKGSDPTKSIFQVANTGITVFHGVAMVGGKHGIYIATGDVADVQVFVRDCNFINQNVACLASDANSGSSYLGVEDCYLFCWGPPDTGVPSCSAGVFPSIDNIVFRGCTIGGAGGTFDTFTLGMGDGVKFAIEDCTIGGFVAFTTAVHMRVGGVSTIRSRGNRWGGEHTGTLVRWESPAPGYGKITLKDDEAYCAGGYVVACYNSLPVRIEIDEPEVAAAEGPVIGTSSHGVYIDSSVPASEYRLLGATKEILLNGSPTRPQLGVIYSGATVGSLMDLNSSPGALACQLTQGLYEFESSINATDLVLSLTPLTDPEDTYRVRGGSESAGGTSDGANTGNFGPYQLQIEEIVCGGANGSRHIRGWGSGMAGLPPGYYTACVYVNVVNLPCLFANNMQNRYQRWTLPVGPHMISLPFWLDAGGDLGVAFTIDGLPNSIVQVGPTRVFKGRIKMNRPNVVASGTVSTLTSGRWLKGDRIERNAAAGGFLGDICVSDGRLAPAWLGAHAYSVGQYVTNDSGKVYRAISVTSDAQSASSGGPTGTGASIVDNHVTWAYVEPQAVFKAYGAISA